MAGTTQTTTIASSTLKAFEDKIKTQIAEAKANLAQLDAKAKQKKSAAEAATINRLNTAKQDIDRKLQDLKTTHASHVARARSDIEADAAKLKASIKELGAKFAVVFLAIALTLGAGATRLGAQPRAETLLYAVYDGQDTAGQVFKTMRSAQGSQTGERIEAYAVVSKDMKGNVHVRDQRRRDGGVGAVLGGVIGLIGGPIGVAAGAAAGGAVGYLTGDAVGIPRDKVESMQASLTPNTSALVVVLNDRWVQDTERSLNQAHARAVIANQIAGNQKPR